MTGARESRAIPATRGSSALSTARPSGATARTRATFSARTPSSEPRNSVWACATVVTAATVGRASSASVAISPGCWLPISSTSAWCSWVSLRSVSGSPHWLLRSEEHTSELQSRRDLVCRLLLEKKKKPEKHIVLLHIVTYDRNGIL